MSLSIRERTILHLIVGDYIHGAAPVASEALARRRGLDVSGATIRNDVMDLERRGFLTRPHPSAGAVPLEKAYRVYVESILEDAGAYLPAPARASIKRKLLGEDRRVEEWRDSAALVLASLVGNMAIATFPSSDEARIRHIGLVGLRDVLGLLIVVLDQARVKQQFVRFRAPMSGDDLQSMGNKMNALLGGKSSREIAGEDMELSEAEAEVLETAVDILRAEDDSVYEDHFLAGLVNLLSQPEYADKSSVDVVIQSVEDGTLGRAVLAQAPRGSVVRVIIGHENDEEVLTPLSVVLGRYGAPGGAHGVIGAIGPVRMEYGRAIAGVEFVSRVMTEGVEDW